MQMDPKTQYVQPQPLRLRPKSIFLSRMRRRVYLDIHDSSTAEKKLIWGQKPSAVTIHLFDWRADGGA